MIKKGFLFLIVLFQLFSCQNLNDNKVNSVKQVKNDIKKQYFSLGVGIDSLLDGSLIESIYITNSKNYILMYEPPYFYFFDSLEFGKHELVIESIFNQKIKHNIEIKKDSEYLIKNLFNYQKVSYFTKDEFEQADTIHFNYANSGCFHLHQEKGIFIKNTPDDLYLFQFNELKKIERKNLSFTLKKVDYLNLINELYELQYQTFKNKAKSKPLNGYIYVSSTTNQYLMIKIKNKVFYFNDSEIENWDMYSKFKDYLEIQLIYSTLQKIRDYEKNIRKPIFGVCETLKFKQLPYDRIL